MDKVEAINKQIQDLKKDYKKQQNKLRNINGELTRMQMVLKLINEPDDFTSKLYGEQIETQSILGILQSEIERRERCLKNIKNGLNVYELLF